MNGKVPAALIVIFMGIGLGLQYWYWPQLPEKMATHFDAQGNPNGWMDKPAATLSSVGLVSLLPLLFVGLGVSIRWLPTSMINMPHREYWLTGERREESLRWMVGWMLWFSVSITIFLVALNHLTFIANRDAQPLQAVWFWSLLGAFLLATATQVVCLLIRFRSPK